MNLDSLYDQAPVLIRLVGGPGDGRQIYTPDPPSRIRSSYFIPTPLNAADLISPGNLAVHSIRASRYDYQGRIADDGARLFHYAGQMPQ